MIRNDGLEPAVIEYLKTPPSQAEAPAAIAISEEFRALCAAPATYMAKAVKTVW
jgi:arsenate reductase-like glutaredoxin family protein